MKNKVKNFLDELTMMVTLIAGLVSILAFIATFFKAPDALIFLTFSLPIFIFGALMLTFVVKDGWSRLFGEVIAGIFHWPF